MSGRGTVVSFVFGDFLQGAVQYFTEAAEGVGADVVVFPQPVKLPGAEPVIFHEPVLGNALGLHRLPKAVIYDHPHHPP